MLDGGATGLLIAFSFISPANPYKCSLMAWKYISEALGMADGGRLRLLAGNLFTALGLDRLISDGPSERKVAFTVALIALCAKLTKADGVSLKVEADAFEQIYHVPPEERENVRRLFDLARQDMTGYDTYATRLSKLLDKEPELKRSVLHAFLHIALADGVLHEAEETYVRYVAVAFGCSPTAYRAIRAMFVHDETDPYIVLGIPHESSNDEIKRTYRRLARENHPDALIAAGVPEDYAAVADEKIRAINAAYDEIAKERGL